MAITGAVDPEYDALMAGRAGMVHAAPVEREALAHAALEYDAMGWPVVLLREGTKRAAFKGWEERRMPRPELAYHLRRGAYNVGLLLGNVVVFDKDAASREAYDFMRRHRLKSPMEVETAKGVHVYMRLGREIVEVRSRIRFLGMPLDVLMGERYTVGPPSWAAETEWCYRLRPDKQIVAPGDLPPVPEAVLELLERREEAAPVAPVLGDSRHGAGGVDAQLDTPGPQHPGPGRGSCLLSGSDQDLLGGAQRSGCARRDRSLERGGIRAASVGRESTAPQDHVRHALYGHEEVTPMFKIGGLRRGDCDNNETHTDREVLVVEDLVTRQGLILCPKCFLAQFKLRSKGNKTEQTNGQLERSEP